MDHPKSVAIDKLKPHPRNPRLSYREDVIAGIVAGLNGEMSPEHSLRVRPIEKGFLEIVSGHHRWQAGLRKGLKELPCWVREMTDDEAYMALVKDNAQGELSNIEKAIHCFGKLGEIKPGTRSTKLAAYAKETGWSSDLVVKLHQAGEVASIESDKLKGFNLADVAYASLVMIRSLPRDLWPDFVKVMLVKIWSVNDTQQAVSKARAYLENPITGHEFLPKNECALAVAVGNKSSLQLSMLARAAEAATAYLEEENPDKLSEWHAWLTENMGGDSWDAGKLEAKSAEFMPEPPPKPVLDYKTIEKSFYDFWTLVSTINNPNTPEHQGCGGMAAVCEGLEPAQQKELYHLVLTHCESLQEWVEIVKEFIE